ncbi:MAG: hypothetical protein ACI92E_000284 [Oceanicoccus sp.]|jgi:hypothetical protein
MSYSKTEKSSISLSLDRTVDTSIPEALKTLELYTIWRASPSLSEIIDPFSFPQRVAVYRLLLEATNVDGLFGADNAGNPLWGLLFQLHWQQKTCRLDPVGKSKSSIDENSPWGYGNFSLCIIPLLGAVRAGTVKDFSIAKPVCASRFDYAYGESQASRFVPDKLHSGALAWEDFFRAVNQAKLGDDSEHLRMLLWRAHKICLDVIAERLEEIEATLVSTEEFSFLQGWCRMVDYLWAAAWPTDFHFMVERGSDALPGKMLERADLSDISTALPASVQKTVAGIIALESTSKIRHRFNLWLWRRIMRNRNARADVVVLLDAVFNPSKGNLKERKQLFRYLL